MKKIALNLCWLFFFFILVADAAAISFVQVNAAVPQTPQSSVSVTYTAAQTAGNLNVVAVGWSDSTAVVNSVTDSRGNVYSRAVGPTIRSGVASQSIYYAKNIVAAAANSNTVTVQFNVPAIYPDIRILEYSGLDRTNPVDVVKAATGTNATSDSGAVTTTNANDLLFAANLVQTSTRSAGSGFTSRIITNPDGDIAEDRIVTATGSYRATAPLTGAGPWIMQMVAFKAAAPDISITKTHSGNFTQGQTGATYAITVTNNGPGSTSGTVTMIDTLPGGLTATALSGSGWTCTLTTLTCTRSNALAAGAAYPPITMTVNVANNAPASVTNTATASGGGDNSPGNNTANDVTIINGGSDTTAPDTSITGNPANPTNSASATFSFTGTDNVTPSASLTFDCQLDGSGFTVCTSPRTYSSLISGTHSFQVRATDQAGNVDQSPASFSWTVDTTAPTVTINQASGQLDPTNASPINFTAIFSEAVTGFSSGGVSIGGTAGGTKSVVVSGSGTTYNVAVSGMTSSGTVIVTVSANAAQDSAGNGSTASTSTDNTVTYQATGPTVTINQASGQADPTNASPINFTAIFSTSVTGFNSGGVAIGGTAGGTKTVTVTGSGTTYNVAVSGMTSNGTVIASVSANAAQDSAGNGNTASTSTDNTVNYDVTRPSVTINQASGQQDPTSASPINFTVIFSEAVTGFSSSGVVIGGTAGGTKTVTVTGSGTTYNVAVSGMTNGTVIASVSPNAAQDAAGNGNTASTSTDNSVTYAVITPSGLVAAYSFNEGTGTTVTDASGKGNTGTIQGATWTAAGKYGNALVFNGTNALVTIADSTSLRLTTAMTLEAWVNPSAVTSAWRDVIYKGDDIYYLEGTSDNGGVAAMGGTFSPSPLYGATGLPVNTWTHLAATYDGTTMRLYVNATQVASRAQAGNILTSTNPLQIGGDSIYGQYFAGTIDEVRIYNVALTQAEIQTDMNTPIGGGTPSDTTPPQVVITFPPDNAQVNDILTVTADAFDNVGVAGVQFLVDNVNVGTEDTNPPYGLSWDTRTVTNGAHIITARARDTSGNTAYSVPVTVNVANANFFQNEILATGFNLPTSIKFLPDGRMLVVELQGTIKILPPPYTQPDPTPFLQLTNVGSAGVQQGIYDIALDPDFLNNHHYYIFYTAGSPNRDRLSRLTANASLTGTVAGSELILYQDPQNANAEHHGGAINFGNDGKIYFTTGEHFNAGDAQLLSSPRGKVHRINKDGTVPTDNPFHDNAGPNWDSIWALGLRNPYRAYYDAPTGRLIIGDVGGNDYSVAKEEVNLGAAGANYGWPNSEGPCSVPCTSPIYFYPHNGRDASITGGFVYHGTQFPSSYHGSYFFADYTQNWIRRLTFDVNGNVNGVFNFEPADGSVDGPYGDIVYLIEGPDGALYYVDLGYSDIGGTFGLSKIRRIRYVQSNQAPIAIASAIPTSGPVPLTVDFSSAGSLDPEGQPITYFWTFGDGATSTAPNPVHIYTQTGQHTVRLTVSDGVNSTLSTPLFISVGNKPIPTILSPQDGSFFIAGDTIFFNGDATDVEDGSLPASAFTWNIDFLHEGHVHPGIPLTGVKSGSFDIPMSGHDFSGNTRYRIQLTATDSSGLQGIQSVLVYPTKVNLTFDSLPTGLILTLDGIDRTTPFAHDTLANFNHTIEAPNQTQGQNTYTFGSWSDGGAQQHVITVPPTARSYTASYTVTQNPLPAGLVAGWSFNEGTGTSAGDASGNNNILTLLNGATWTGGRYNGGLSLSGNASASASSSASLSLSGSYTLTAWINPASLIGYQTVLIKENSFGNGGCGYWLQTGGNQISSGFNNGSGCSEHTAIANLQTNVWYHIAAVFDDTANAYQIYLNGTLLANQLETTVPIPNNQNLTIGRTAFGENWNGLLDEVRIYNRALSQAEIQSDMNTPLP